MDLSNIKIDDVEFNRITPIFYEDVSHKRVKTFHRLVKEKKPLGSYMILEEDHINNEYWLISGYPEYLAYKEGRSTSKVPCILRPLSNETEQRIELLQKMFFHQPTKWLDKFNLISKLIEANCSVSYIANKMGVSKSDIEKYLIHPGIPKEYIEMTISNKRSLITLEKIRKLNELHPFLKDRLYYRASLPKSDDNKLTDDNLQKVKWLLNLEEFFKLEKEQQWNLIEKAIKYKQELIASWEREIFKLLDPSSVQSEIIFRRLDPTSDFYQKYEM